MKTNIFNALKEALRLLVFSVPAVLIQAVTNDPVLSSWAGGAVLIVLKAIDRAIHEGENPFKGILPF